MKPLNGQISIGAQANGNPSNGHIIPLSLELNCGQTAVDVPSFNGSNKPTSFELGAEALGDVDYVDSGLGRTAYNMALMQTSSTSTVTNGHNGCADLTPPADRNNRELSTSTTEISDSHIRNSYGAPRMSTRNGVLYLNDFNENPIACSSRQHSFASLTNGLGSRAECPAASCKLTNSKKGQLLPASEKGLKKSETLVQQWIDDDGLTKVPDVQQERMAEITKAYEVRSLSLILFA